MADTCTCEAAPVLIFPCSGGSNVGQIANQAAVELTKEGVGKLFCLAGIGGHVESFIESSKGNRLVVIDGCPTACARKIFDHVNLPVTDYIVVTGLDIKKAHNFDLERNDIEKVCAEVKRRLQCNL
ncbi:DGC domain protein [Desulfofundulus kuznetsovii DSM 6115]|uniref:DGC domain protein n=1 Tax=Desulfofundulus kuznetsovii (strain DSM 6115 / VKM B-1805 / 17) TaxID=760568 RepID=A0AAU8PEL2_DESK7|nr:DGC domain protein [Desulfofundulus kuznetsovii DSM 6115]